MVSNIRDISFIHLYERDDIVCYPFLKFKCDGKEYAYSYEDADFALVLSKLWQVYNDEGKKAIVFGDFDLDTVLRCLEPGKYVVNSWHLQSSSLLYSDKDINKLRKYESYLRNVIRKIIMISKPDCDLLFYPMHGHKNKFSMMFSIDGVMKQVSFIISCADKLYFKTSYIDDLVLPIEGSVEICDDSVFVNYKDSSGRLKFNDVYDVFSSDKVISFKEEELIKLYFDLCGLGDYERLVKTTDDSYLFFSFDFLNDTECELLCGHIVLGDKVLIDYKREYGTSNYGHELFIPKESVRSSITICPMDRSHVLVEKYFPSTSISTFGYKNRISGNYAYELATAEYDNLGNISSYSKAGYLTDINDLSDIRDSLSDCISDKRLIKDRRHANGVIW